MNKKEIVNNTINYIEQKLAETAESGLTLDEIAGETGYSKAYLNRVFGETTGVTMHQYIIERRLTEAAQSDVCTEYRPHCRRDHCGYRT